jgi:hypothetical protein
MLASEELQHGRFQKLAPSRVKGQPARRAASYEYESEVAGDVTKSSEPRHQHHDGKCPRGCFPLLPELEIRIDSRGHQSKPD